MKKEFDFKSIGKRTPYRVPDGFFDELDRQVMAAVKEESQPHSIHRMSWIRTTLNTVAATAAVVGLFFMCNPFQTRNEKRDTDKVEQAFNQLSSEDQAFMLQVYQEDVFLNP